MKRPVTPLLLPVSLALLCLCGCAKDEPGSSGVTGAGAHGAPVTITAKAGYFEVLLDYTTGVTPRAMGEAYGEALRGASPDIEAKLDSYLSELSGNDLYYAVALSRVRDIAPALPASYRDELEGLGSRLSGGTVNVRGDGRISVEELFGLNLISDVGRPSACSGLGVFGARSATGRAMVARLLDWNGGSVNQLAYFHALTTVRKSSGSVCLISYLGYLGAVTAFNDQGVFAGILDAGTGEAYSSAGRRSYVMDLRLALESRATLDAVGADMADPSRLYTYHHNILLADAGSCKVLENDLNRDRALRSADSALLGGLTWEYGNAVAVVNSFVLAGHYDNHTRSAANTARWASFRAGLAGAGATVDFEELRAIASYDGADGLPGSMSAGDIYNAGTQSIVLFEPLTRRLEVSFRPVSGPAADPLFLSVNAQF